MDPIYTQHKAPTYLESLSDSAKDSVLVVQPGRGYSRDEELGAVGARPAVRHRHCEGAVVSVCACVKQEDVRSKCADSSNNIIYSCIVLEYTYIYTYIHLTYKLIVEYNNHIKTPLVSVKTVYFHSIIECKISAFPPNTHRRFLWNSSSNSRPQMDSPPVPSPLGSPVCSMKPLMTRWNSSLQ